MLYTGHCNCDSIHITLPEQPAKSLLCHCDCCKRAGGAFSVNYPVSENEMSVGDYGSALKIYYDKNSDSGNIVERYFCSTCGSALFSKTPKDPGKAFLKAHLFDNISPSGSEVYGQKRLKL